MYQFLVGEMKDAAKASVSSRKSTVERDKPSGNSNKKDKTSRPAKGFHRGA
jgi:hypothetical protein